MWTGEIIKTERQRANWTQAELADHLGCRQQTISEWEIGKYLPKNAYQRLLDIAFKKTLRKQKSANHAVSAGQ